MSSSNNDYYAIAIGKYGRVSRFMCNELHKGTLTRISFVSEYLLLNSQHI